MAAPSSSLGATRLPPMHPALAVVLYVAVSLVVLTAGMALRAVVDRPEARDAAPAPPAAGVATPSTASTIPLPVVVVPTTAPPPPPALTTTVAAAPAPQPAVAATPAPAPLTDRMAVWYALADCESGRWGARKIPVPGTATWDIVDEIHQGGLQIRGGQWDQHRPAGFPEDAHIATPAQQIAVAEIIFAGQGWQAWPTCGPRVGLDRLT